MIRGSFLILALASAFALNGCSRCSNSANETAPPAEMAPEATPAEQPPGMEGEAAPMDPAAPNDSSAAPEDGAAAPAEEGAGH